MLAAHLVLIVAGSIIVGDPPKGDAVTPVSTQFWATLPFWLAAIGGTWWMVGRTEEDVPAALGLRIRPLDVPVGIAVGVFMQLAVIPFVYRFVLFQDQADLDRLEAPARRLVDSAHGGVAITFLLLLTAVGAPLAEETLYRGLLQRGAGRNNALLGVGVAAVVFGLAHFQPFQLLGLVLFGASSGLLVWRTGRLGPGVVAHMAFNATAVIHLWLR